ncbi:MAG: Crp/Fnr family transcriptional regulator [Rhodospirillales bacterium]|nr:Crp/Fnr family transcriptional regulator [Rhodospirillales bacterium]
MSSAGIRELLTTNSLFRDLADEVIGKIAELAVTRELAAGQLLFSKGDPGDALYGVMSGRIRISAGAPSGKEVVLNTIEAGEVFGEIALLDGRPRTADAVAAVNSELMRIQRRDFIHYMESEPRLATHLLEMLCQRVRATSELVEDSAFLALPARLAKRLLGMAGYAGDPGGDLGEIDFDNLELKISQQELGQLMDSSREAVNKHLQNWRRRGWVELSRNRVTIVDPEALSDLVERELDG